MAINATIALMVNIELSALNATHKNSGPLNVAMLTLNVSFFYSPVKN
jgi:hypothetical protein